MPSDADHRLPTRPLRGCALPARRWRWRACSTWLECFAFVTVEEGAIMGGAGSAVLEALQDLQQLKPVLVLGIGDVFTEHGDPTKLLAEMGLDAAGVQMSIQKRCGARLSPL